MLLVVINFSSLNNNIKLRFSIECKLKTSYEILSVNTIVNSARSPDNHNLYCCAVTFINQLILFSNQYVKGVYKTDDTNSHATGDQYEDTSRIGQTKACTRDHSTGNTKGDVAY